MDPLPLAPDFWPTYLVFVGVCVLLKTFTGVCKRHSLRGWQDIYCFRPSKYVV